MKKVCSLEFYLIFFVNLNISWRLLNSYSYILQRINSILVFVPQVMNLYFWEAKHQNLYYPERLDSELKLLIEDYMNPDQGFNMESFFHLNYELFLNIWLMIYVKETLGDRKIIFYASEVNLHQYFFCQMIQPSISLRTENYIADSF